MIHFTDPNLYVKGICSAQAKDTATGDILFSSNKFNTGNINFSVNADPLRAGLGNPIATIIESDPDITVNFTQANFDMVAKMSALGGSVAYNAVTPVCQTVTANSSTITIDVTEGAPVAPYGYTSPICHVQEVGAASLIGADGVAYAITNVGVITDFAATSSKTYKVWYYVAKPTSMVGTINSLMNSKVVNFEAQLAVYSNVVSGTNQGTRVGWLYIVVPYLKLMAEGGNVTGDNSNYDTTVISGRAVSEDDQVVSATCTNCASADLAYYIYAPDAAADTILGLTTIAGYMILDKGATRQIQPYLVLANNQLVPLRVDDCTFTDSGSTLPTGTTVSATGLVTAGNTAGTGEVSIQYSTTGFSDYTFVNVEVV